MLNYMVGALYVYLFIPLYLLLRLLFHQHQSKIRNYLYAIILELDPPKESGKALSLTKKGLWCYLVNKFRILWKLEEDKLIILALKIANRDVVYED